MPQQSLEPEEEKKEIEISDNLTAAFYVFMQHFVPAHSLADSDEQLSTSDINYSLQELLSIFEVSNSAIVKLMTENNYKYTWDNGFKWLLKIQPKSIQM